MRPTAKGVFKMQEVKTILYQEKGTFTDKETNTDVEYSTYYVDIMGIKVKIKPADGTAKQLLALAFAK